MRNYRSRSPPPSKRAKVEHSSPVSSCSQQDDSQLQPTQDSVDQAHLDDDSGGYEERNEDDQVSDNENNCSICLQEIVDRTVLPTCSHEFCFDCVLMWTGQSRRCPLCSQAIGEYLIHNIRSHYDYRKHYLTPLRVSPPPSDTRSQAHALRMQARGRRRQREMRLRATNEREELDRLELSIAKRKWIYKHNLYAKHVASNSYTKYRPCPTPSQFAASADLISRTTSFLRRELQVWEGLDVEFLTTMTISLMKSIDIRSETAVKLLSEFLDMDAQYVPGERHFYAEHFAHEVYTYLRSPYKDLFVYDTVVQYEDPRNISPPPEPRRNYRWYDRTADHSNSPETNTRSHSPQRVNQRRKSKPESPTRSASVSWSPSGRHYSSSSTGLDGVSIPYASNSQTHQDSTIRHSRTRTDNTDVGGHDESSHKRNRRSISSTTDAGAACVPHHGARQGVTSKVHGFHRPDLNGKGKQKEKSEEDLMICTAPISSGEDNTDRSTFSNSNTDTQAVIENSISSGEIPRESQPKSAGSRSLASRPARKPVQPARLLTLRDSVRAHLGTNNPKSRDQTDGKYNQGSNAPSLSPELFAEPTLSMEANADINSLAAGSIQKQTFCNESPDISHQEACHNRNSDLGGILMKSHSRVTGNNGMEDDPLLTTLSKPRPGGLLKEFGGPQELQPPSDLPGLQDTSTGDIPEMRSARGPAQTTVCRAKDGERGEDRTDIDNIGLNCDDGIEKEYESMTRNITGSRSILRSDSLLGAVADFPIGRTEEPSHVRSSPTIDNPIRKEGQSNPASIINLSHSHYHIQVTTTTTSTNNTSIDTTASDNSTRPNVSCGLNCDRTFPEDDMELSASTVAIEARLRMRAHLHIRLASEKRIHSRHILNTK